MDDNCDSTVPADEADADGDGYRVCAGDCNDGDATIHPGASEVCDGVDNDCDGNVDATTLSREDFKSLLDENGVSNQSNVSVSQVLDFDGGSFELNYDLHVNNMISGSESFGLYCNSSSSDSQYNQSFISVTYYLENGKPIVLVDGYSSGLIPRNDFEDDSLVQTFLDGNVLHSTDISPEYVYFSGNLKTQAQLSTKLNQLGVIDQEMVLSLWNYAVSGSSFGEKLILDDAEGIWFHHLITYNENTQQVSVIITRENEGVEDLLLDSTYDVQNGFSEEMRFLILNSQNAVLSASSITGYLNNVNIQSVCTPSPPGNVTTQSEKDDDKGNGCSVGNGPHRFGLSEAVNLLLLIILPLGGITFWKRYRQ